MSYQKLPFHPGIYKDDSPLEAKGYWVDADKIRFVRGLPETIYGWERASSSALLGICRGAMTWADNGRNPFAAFGTYLRLYAMDVDGNVTDITPVSSRTASASISFTTTNGSATVTAAWTAHGLTADQKFMLESATVTSVGGVTINGTYTVASVSDANTITFTAAQAAASNAGPTASTVHTTACLAPGQIDGMGGLGYGVGGYGSGGYGGSSSGYTLYPRTWSLAPWGQNLIANPRGGGIYEWAPNATATELTTNGAFIGSATGWTLNSWSYAANAISLAGAATSSATQSVTLPIGAWCVVSFDVTAYTTGAFQVSVGGSNIGSAASAAGHYWAVFHSGAGGAKTLSLNGTSATLTIDNVTCQVLTTANLIANAPTQVTCVFTTGERILVACGCPDTNANFDALRVRWTDTQNNQAWTVAATNLAGAYTLTNGSRIVRGLPGNRENLILTDTAAYAMRYVPDPNVVYSFTEIAAGCGLIGPNAVCQVGGVFYWMDSVGGFWAYDGSYPRPLRCTLARDVRDNLADAQQDKIYAFPLTVNGRIEVWWQYPDIRDGNECSRYVAYQVTESEEQGAPVWTSGTFARTAWVNAGVFQFPLAVDTAGAIWFHEKDFTEDGAARSWSLTSSYVDLGDGDGHMRINGIQPDAEDLLGGYTVTINTQIKNGSGVSTRAFGPHDVTGTTGKVSVRANGQAAQVVFAATSAPSFWRMGAVRVDLQETGRRR